MADPEARFYITATDQTAAALKSADQGLKGLQRSATHLRGIFASFGVVLSARAFAGWISGALEAKNMTEDQLAATKDARDAVSQMKAASDDLARSLAGALSPAIDLTAKAVIGLNAAFFGFTKVPMERQANALREQIDSIKHEFSGGRLLSDVLGGTNLTDDQKARISDLQKQLDELNKKQLDVLSGGAAWTGNAGAEDLKIAAELTRQLRTETEKNLDTWRDAKRLFDSDLISADTLARLGDSLLEPIKVTAKRLKEIAPTLSPELTQFIADLERGAELAKAMQTETEKNLESLREYQTLLSTGAIDSETFTRLRDSLLEPIEVTQKRLKELQPEAEQWALSLGDGMKSAFAGFLSGAETNFRDFLKRLAAEWATSQIFAALASGIGGGGATSGIGKFFGKIFGGFRADGGPVSAGKSYVVGERGQPELFTPRSAGTITPLGGGPMSITQHLHFDVGLESVDDRIRAAAGPISSATTSAILKALNRPSMA